MSIRGNAPSKYRTPAGSRAGPPPCMDRNSGPVAGYFLAENLKKIEMGAIHRPGIQHRANPEKKFPKGSSPD